MTVRTPNRNKKPAANAHNMTHKKKLMDMLELDADVQFKMSLTGNVTSLLITLPAVTSCYTRLMY
jgi:hypothetical protein